MRIKKIHIKLGHTSHAILIYDLGYTNPNFAYNTTWENMEIEIHQKKCFYDLSLCPMDYGNVPYSKTETD